MAINQTKLKFVLKLTKHDCCFVTISVIFKHISAKTTAKKIIDRAKCIWDKLREILPQP